MDAVWVPTQPYEYLDQGRRLCNERSHPGAEVCGRVYVRIRDRECRWWHKCHGLMHGVAVAYSGLVHGRWYMAMTLDELDRFAERLPAPAVTAAGDADRDDEDLPDNVRYLPSAAQVA
jgi:hypothetical protein